MMQQWVIRQQWVAMVWEEVAAWEEKLERWQYLGKMTGDDGRDGPQWVARIRASTVIMIEKW